MKAGETLYVSGTLPLIKRDLVGKMMQKHKLVRYWNQLRVCWKQQEELWQISHLT
jgi:hypothetical protein